MGAGRRHDTLGLEMNNSVLFTEIVVARVLAYLMFIPWFLIPMGQM